MSSATKPLAARARPDLRPVARSFWRDALRRLLGEPMPLIAGAILLLLVGLAIVGPLLVPYTFAELDLLATNQPPSEAHWFGTDDLGRDMWARAWSGARISLFIGVTAALLDVLIGIVYGGFAGYRGGRADELMMRFVDMLYGIPYLLLVILLAVVFQPGLFSIILAMIVTGWLGSARLVRGQMLQLREMEYVLAARGVGVRFPRLFARHLLPNALGPLIVAVTFSVPHAIFTEATLSFLGLGVPAPLASLGTMVADGLITMLSGQIWRLAIPAGLISLTMLTFNLLGDGMRDALDPRRLN